MLANSEKALYVSLDNLWFSDHSLRDVAEYHYLHGGTHLMIDEVHYYKDWLQLIKNLYDDFPELNLIYTGSSLLKLETGSADLSRRQRIYVLQEMSFREYLEFEGIGKYPVPGRLPDLLENHMDMAEPIVKDIRILAAFDKYLRQGYYPFIRRYIAAMNCV